MPKTGSCARTPSTDHLKLITGRLARHETVGKAMGLSAKSRNEIHLPASRHLSSTGGYRREGRAAGWPGGASPRLELLWGRGGGGRVQRFLIYNCRAPSDPINLGAVFTKTVSYDFSNKYIFQSDGVLFRLNVSRSRHLSAENTQRRKRSWDKAQTT